MTTPTERISIAPTGGRIATTPSVQRINVTTPVTAVVTTRQPDRIVVTAPVVPTTSNYSDDSEGTAEFAVGAGFDIPPYHVVVPRITEGSVRLADPTVLSHMDRPMWLALHGALAGETVHVCAIGRVDNPTAWNWAQGPIWVGLSGALTQTPPAAPHAVFAAPIGYAIGPGAMFVEHGTPIQLTH